MKAAPIQPGDRFARLTVSAPAPRARFFCACDCGVTKVVRGSELRRGHAKSCGCLRREVSAARCRANNPRWGRVGS